MSEVTPSLEVVEAHMAGRRRTGIAFPTAIERQFQIDTHARRCDRLLVGILVSAVIYNLFLVADWLLVPDVLWQAAVLHFGIVTPWMLTVAWLISKRPTPFVTESLAASVPVIIILQIDLGLAATTSELAAHYQYVVIPTLLYTNVSLHRLTFNFARAVTAAVLLCHGVVVLSVSYLSAGVAIMILVQIIVCAYITLVANYTMERDLRRSYLFSLRDRLRHAEAQAASRRDALTGLTNRHHLEEELRKLWGQSGEPTPVSIVMLDIDHFKHLNDRYGHGAGDVCLKRVAAILTAELRGREDHAIRYGGEEFLLLLPNVEAVGAGDVAERIRRAIETAAIPHEGTGVRGVVTASLGVASALVSELTAAELIAAADSALYAAKRNGRNQVWPEPASHSETRPRLTEFVSKSRSAARGSRHRMVETEKRPCPDLA